MPLRKPGSAGGGGGGSDIDLGELDTVTDFTDRDLFLVYGPTFDENYALPGEWLKSVILRGVRRRGMSQNVFSAATYAAALTAATTYAYTDASQYSGSPESFDATWLNAYGASDLLIIQATQTGDPAGSENYFLKLAKAAFSNPTRFDFGSGSTPTLTFASTANRNAAVTAFAALEANERVVIEWQGNRAVVTGITSAGNAGSNAFLARLTFQAPGNRWTNLGNTSRPFTLQKWTTDWMQVGESQSETTFALNELDQITSLQLTDSIAVADASDSGKTVKVPIANARTVFKSYRGLWNTLSGQRLYEGDVVKHGSRWYFVTTEHVRGVNGPDLDTNRFIQITEYNGDWSSGWFSKGGYVIHAGEAYIATANVVGTDPAPNASGNTKWRLMTFSGSWNDLTDKPTLFGGSYNDLSDKPTLFSGAYGDLTGLPTLFDGNYNSLSNRPALAPSNAEQNVQADWNESDSGSDAFIKNKPSSLGGTFNPTKQNLYSSVKAILVHAGSTGATADDANNEIDITGGSGGGSTFHFSEVLRSYPSAAQTRALNGKYVIWVGRGNGTWQLQNMNSDESIIFVVHNLTSVTDQRTLTVRNPADTEDLAAIRRPDMTVFQWVGNASRPGNGDWFAYTQAMDTHFNVAVFDAAQRELKLTRANNDTQTIDLSSLYGGAKAVVETLTADKTFDLETKWAEWEGNNVFFRVEGETKYTATINGADWEPSTGGEGQTFNIPSSVIFVSNSTQGFARHAIEFNDNKSLRPEVTDASLKFPGETAYLDTVWINRDGTVELRFAEDRNEDAGNANDRLSDNWEQSGQVIISYGDRSDPLNTLTIELSGTDTTEPYLLSNLPNAAEVTAFFNRVQRLGQAGWRNSNVTVTLKADVPDTTRRGEQATFHSLYEDGKVEVVNMKFARHNSDGRIQSFNASSTARNLTEGLGEPFKLIYAGNYQDGSNASPWHVSPLTQDVRGAMEDYVTANRTRDLLGTLVNDERLDASHIKNLSTSLTDSNIVGRYIAKASLTIPVTGNMTVGDWAIQSGADTVHEQASGKKLRFPSYRPTGRAVFEPRIGYVIQCWGISGDLDGYLLGEAIHVAGQKEPVVVSALHSRDTPQGEVIGEARFEVNVEFDTVADSNPALVINPTPTYREARDWQSTSFEIRVYSFDLKGIKGDKGDAFTPSKQNLYSSVKAILVHSGSSGASADDANNEIDITGGSSSGGATSFSGLSGSIAASQIPDNVISPADLDADTTAKKTAFRTRIGAGTSNFGGAFSDLSGTINGGNQIADRSIPSTKIRGKTIGRGELGDNNIIIPSMLDSGDSTKQAAFRTAIGAGTSNFDGAYGSLTGRPSIPSVPQNASSAEALAGTNDTKFMTPKDTSDVLRDYDHTVAHETEIDALRRQVDTITTTERSETIPYWATVVAPRGESWYVDDLDNSSESGITKKLEIAKGSHTLHYRAYNSSGAVVRDHSGKYFTAGMVAEAGGIANIRDGVIALYVDPVFTSGEVTNAALCCLIDANTGRTLVPSPAEFSHTVTGTKLWRSFGGSTSSLVQTNILSDTLKNGQRADTLTLYGDSAEIEQFRKVVTDSDDALIDTNSLILHDIAGAQKTYNVTNFGATTLTGKTYNTGLNYADLTLNFTGADVVPETAQVLRIEAPEDDAGTASWAREGDTSRIPVSKFPTAGAGNPLGPKIATSANFTVPAGDSQTEYGPASWTIPNIYVSSYLEGNPSSSLRVKPVRRTTQMVGFICRLIDTSDDSVVAEILQPFESSGSIRRQRFFIENSLTSNFEITATSSLNTDNGFFLGVRTNSFNRASSHTYRVEVHEWVDSAFAAASGDGAAGTGGSIGFAGSFDILRRQEDVSVTLSGTSTDIGPYTVDANATHLQIEFTTESLSPSTVTLEYKDPISGTWYNFYEEKPAGQASSLASLAPNQTKSFRFSSVYLDSQRRLFLRARGASSMSGTLSLNLIHETDVNSESESARELTNLPTTVQPTTLAANLVGASWTEIDLDVPIEYDLLTSLTLHFETNRALKPYEDAGFTWTLTKDMMDVIGTNPGALANASRVKGWMSIGWAYASSVNDAKSFREAPSAAYAYQWMNTAAAGIPSRIVGLQREGVYLTGVMMAPFRGQCVLAKVSCMRKK